MHIRNRVLFAALRGPVFNHQCLKLGVEAAGAVALHACEVMSLDGEALEEAPLDLDEEAKRDTPPERGVRNHEKRQSPSGGMLGGVLGGRGGDIVDVVIIVCVGELLGGGVLNLGQNERGERGCL